MLAKPEQTYVQLHTHSQPPCTHHALPLLMQTMISPGQDMVWRQGGSLAAELTWEQNQRMVLVRPAGMGYVISADMSRATGSTGSASKPSSEAQMYSTPRRLGRCEAMAVSTMKGSASVMHVASMSLYFRVASTSGPATAACADTASPCIRNAKRVPSHHRRIT